MARYIGPKSRIARRFGEAIFGPDKVLDKRNYAPGQHGVNRRKKMSEYGTQLAEKQKAKYTYGVLERQFRLLFAKASRIKGITGEILLQLLESRLDNIVYRLGIAPTRAAARQLVSHCHITVNGKVVNIPSYEVRKGDVIALKETSRKSEKFKVLIENITARTVPSWMDVDKENIVATIKELPKREDVDFPFEEHLIVELYSK